MNKTITLVPTAVLVAGLLLVGCAPSSAASPAPTAQSTNSPTTGNGASVQGGSGQVNSNASSPGRGAPIFGSVNSVSGDTMVVKTQQGTTNVKLTGATIQKTVDGTAADLTAGENVVVVGRQNSDGSVTASNIQVRPVNAGGQGGFQGRTQGQAPGQGQGRGQGQGQNQNNRPVAGSVVSLSGSTLTLKNRQGNTTKVDISGARIQKTVDGTTADLKSGENVVVIGQQGSDGTVSASNVQIRPAGTPTPGQGRRGPQQPTPAATSTGQ